MSPTTLATLITTGGVIFSAILLFLSTHGKTKTDYKNELDKRIDARVGEQLSKAWERIDHLEKQSEELESQYDTLERRQRERDGAFARILRAIANQWPSKTGPDLDPADIALVEDTIPTGWIRRDVL